MQDHLLTTKEAAPLLGVSIAFLDRDRWDWMQRYRLWEANRKVFLYPENWITSELRDDTSPFYKELESSLLQKDVNSQTVEDALQSGYGAWRASQQFLFCNSVDYN